MRIISTVFALAVLISALAVPAGATLIDIGTGTYGSIDYNLIYDDNPSGSVVWLDYTNPVGSWAKQVAWVGSLNTAIVTYNFLPHYSMNWGSGWQLPTTVNNLLSTVFPPATTSSQMAYLYYAQLGNTAGSGLVNTGPFTQLQNTFYWSGTEFSAVYPFYFVTIAGSQGIDVVNGNALGLADRPGQLITAAVPEPSTMLLLGIGLAGVGLLRRRKKVKRG